VSLLSEDDQRPGAGDAESMQHLEQSGRRILVIATSPCPCPGLADEVARRAVEESSEVVVVAPALKAAADAHEQARLAIHELTNRGVHASATIGDRDPMMAIEDALHEFAATEIIIATPPPTHSQWLERGVVRTAKTRFEVPVVEFVLDS
jgi:NAD(P)-dependent dehydrogenase (short-subunit alcohol dehydrogenase family)